MCSESGPCLGRVNDVRDPVTRLEDANPHVELGRQSPLNPVDVLAF